MNRSPDNLPALSPAEQQLLNWYRQKFGELNSIVSDGNTLLLTSLSNIFKDRSFDDIVLGITTNDALFDIIARCALHGSKSIDNAIKSISPFKYYLKCLTFTNQRSRAKIYYELLFYYIFLLQANAGVVTKPDQSTQIKMIDNVNFIVDSKIIDRHRKFNILISDITYKSYKDNAIKHFYNFYASNLTNPDYNIKSVSNCIQLKPSESIVFASYTASIINIFKVYGFIANGRAKYDFRDIYTIWTAHALCIGHYYTELSKTLNVFKR